MLLSEEASVTSNKADLEGRCRHIEALTFPHAFACVSRERGIVADVAIAVTLKASACLHLIHMVAASLRQSKAGRGQ